MGNIGARNTIQIRQSDAETIVLQLKQFEQNVMVEIDNAVKQAQSDYESVDATRQARIYAEAALDAEQKTYAVGKATTFEVLQLSKQPDHRARHRKSARWPITRKPSPISPPQEGSTLERNGSTSR